VGLDTALGSLFAAFGLSGASGLNAWLPLLTSALLARFDVVELAAPLDDLSSNTGLLVLAVLTVADFVGDKIPLVDHVLHVLGTAIAPASGAILFTAQTGLETDLPTVVAVVLGALTAGGVHAGRSALRPVSTAATGGLGNPILSLGEDVASLTLVVLSFVVPLLAALLLAWLVIAFLRRRLARRTA
jgi:hypothetical protein